MMLEDLSKGIDVEINFDAIIDVINKLNVEKGREKQNSVYAAAKRTYDRVSV